MPDAYNREERRRLTIQSASSPRKTAAAVLFTTYICIEVAVVIALVSGPTFQRVLALSDTQLGLCLGAVSLGTLMMSLVVGHATSRFGPFRVLLTGLTGLIFALGLIVLSQEFPALLAGLVLAGIAVASVHNAGLTLLADIFPDNTRRIMALAAALWFSSSIVSAPLIGAWLAHAHVRGLRHWSYGLPVLLVMALLAACLLSAYRLLAWTRSRHHQWNGDGASSADNPCAGGYVTESATSATGAADTGGDVRPAASWLWIPPLAFCHGVMTTSFTAWANPMIQAVFQADDFGGSLGYAVFALGIASGRFLLTTVRFVRNDQVLLALSGLAGALLLALALHVPGYWATLAMIGVGAFAASATAPCLFSIVAGKFPRDKSRLYGYQEASIALGSMTGPFVVGLLVDLSIPVQWAMMLSPMAAMSLGLGSLLWWRCEATAVRSGYRGSAAAQ